MDRATKPAKTHRARKSGPKPPKEIENLTGLLERICSLVECGVVPAERVASVRLHDIFEAIGRRAYGPLLLLLGLIAISPVTAVPGATWAFAGLTLAVALQLTMGAPSPLMPPNLMRMEISSSGLVKAIDALRPWAKRIDWFLKPRLTFLVRAPWVILIGLLVAAAALVTFPLGFIPFAPMIPGLAIVLFGLGLVAKDGLLLLAGVGAVAGACFLARDAVMRLIPMAQDLLARIGG